MKRFNSNKVGNYQYFGSIDQKVSILSLKTFKLSEVSRQNAPDRLTSTEKDLTTSVRGIFDERGSDYLLAFWSGTVEESCRVSINQSGFFHLLFFFYFIEYEFKYLVYNAMNPQMYAEIKDVLLR